MGCGGEAEDSIEQYSRCRILCKLHQDELGLEVDWFPLRWLGSGSMPDISPDPSLLHFQGALGAYAAHRATNMARQAQGLKEEVTKQAFRQALLEGIAGHLKTMQLLQ